MDLGQLTEKVYKLVADNTATPSAGVGVLCACVAMMWVEAEMADGEPPNDLAMCEEFSVKLLDAVRTFRGDFGVLQ
jgi:hypothetical protein